MPFKLLKHVISHLKKKSTCPFCKSQFNEESIFVLATTVGSPISNGLFLIICPKCAAEAFVMVETQNITEQFKQGIISIKTKTAPHGQGISSDEILDMHNFLQNWQGDFKELII